MTSPLLEALRNMQKDTKEAKEQISDGVNEILQAMMDRQKQFEHDKERIKNDIKRGARLSRGKIPH